MACSKYMKEKIKNLHNDVLHDLGRNMFDEMLRLYSTDVGYQGDYCRDIVDCVIEEIKRRENGYYAENRNPDFRWGRM